MTAQATDSPFVSYPFRLSGDAQLIVIPAEGGIVVKLVPPSFSRPNVPGFGPIEAVRYGVLQEQDLDKLQEGIAIRGWYWKDETEDTPSLGIFLQDDNSVEITIGGDRALLMEAEVEDLIETMRKPPRTFATVTPIPIDSEARETERNWREEQKRLLTEVTPELGVYGAGALPTTTGRNPVSAAAISPLRRTFPTLDGDGVVEVSPFGQSVRLSIKQGESSWGPIVLNDTAIDELVDVLVDQSRREPCIVGTTSDQKPCRIQRTESEIHFQSGALWARLSDRQAQPIFIAIHETQNTASFQSLGGNLLRVSRIAMTVSVEIITGVGSPKDHGTFHFSEDDLRMVCALLGNPAASEAYRPSQRYSRPFSIQWSDLSREEGRMDRVITIQLGPTGLKQPVRVLLSQSDAPRLIGALRKASQPEPGETEAADDDGDALYDAFGMAPRAEGGRVRIVSRLGIFGGDRVTAISGGTENMKSLTSIELAIAIARQASSALGGAVALDISEKTLRDLKGDMPSRFPVAYLDWENPGAIVTAERIRYFGGQDVLDNTLRLLAPTISMCDPSFEQMLTKLMFELGPLVCFIDSLQKGCQDQKEFLSSRLTMIGGVGAKTRVVFIIIVHPIKEWRSREGIMRLEYITGRELSMGLWADAEDGVLTIGSIKNAEGEGQIKPVRTRLIVGGNIDPNTGHGDKLRFEAVDVRSRRIAVQKTTSAIAQRTPGRARLVGTMADRIVQALADRRLPYTELLGRAKGRKAEFNRALKQLETDGIIRNDAGTYSLAGFPTGSRLSGTST